MGMDKYESLMTVQDLKTRFLLGVNLTTDDGKDYPDEFFEYCVKSAISLLEHDLDIDISPVKRVDFSMSTLASSRWSSSRCGVEIS